MIQYMNHESVIQPQTHDAINDSIKKIILPVGPRCGRGNMGDVFVIEAKARIAMATNKFVQHISYCPPPKWPRLALEEGSEGFFAIFLLHLSQP